MATTPRTRFTVEVTERDIERAHKNDSYHCVVAQAVARTVPAATNIDVDIQTIRFTTGGERRMYLTPYAVQGYIVAFDAGDPIEPFSFQLRDPKRVKRQVKTEAGRVVDRARTTARRQAKERLTSKLKGKSTTAKKSTAAPISDDPNEAARAAYREAKDKVGNVPLTKPTEGDIRRPPPRLHKTKRRAYGHRLLRINQNESAE